MNAGAQPPVSTGPGVIEDFWSEQDTTPDAIDEALRRLLHGRHVADDRLAPARVLNLVVVVDREWKGETANRLDRVGRYHPSRTVLCAVEDRRTTVDARALLSYVEPPDGGVGLMHERVELDVGPGHLARLDTIVDPVLISELPTVLWCPHGHELAVDALLANIDVMLVDSDDIDDPAERFARADRLLQSVYVVDLAWLRTTPWRERLAASFDVGGRRSALSHVSGIEIEHRAESRASALLLIGWLASRLGWRPSVLCDDGGERFSSVAGRANGALDIRFAPTGQQAPGLGCVSVFCEGKQPLAIMLERASGGLRATESFGGGSPREWQILGASRGEGGILGEGVRQALLRDVTYGPALRAARGFCPRGS